jgi:hypothetical protein
LAVRGCGRPGLSKLLKAVIWPRGLSLRANCGLDIAAYFAKGAAVKAP